ncbi:MAG: hypothetical protein QM610_07790 [Chitinophagaceae bacterium]
MLKQIPGTIYIESQRGVVPESGGETFCLFNYNSFSNEHKSPIFPLRYVNETILHAEGAIELDPTDSCCCILPLYNALEVVADSEYVELYPGEMLFLEKYSAVKCINPQKNDSASFIWLTIVAETPFADGRPLSQKVTLPINQVKNEWIDLLNNPTPLKIACVEDRVELAYHPTVPGKTRLFLFNVIGCFEVCGRLLNQNDGLVLWDCEVADMEALNPNSIMLLLEI